MERQAGTRQAIWKEAAVVLRVDANRRLPYRLASQIDVSPTLLGLLNFSYRSRFFGCDVLAKTCRHPHALLANYQTAGLYEHGTMVELRPNSLYRILDARSGQSVAEGEKEREA